MMSRACPASGLPPPSTELNLPQNCYCTTSTSAAATLPPPTAKVRSRIASVWSPRRKDTLLWLATAPTPLACSLAPATTSASRPPPGSLCTTKHRPAAAHTKHARVWSPPVAPRRPVRRLPSFIDCVASQRSSWQRFGAKIRMACVAPAPSPRLGGGGMRSQPTDASR